MKKKEMKRKENASKACSKVSCSMLAAVLLLSSITLSGCAAKTEVAMAEEEKPTEIMVETAATRTNSIQIMSDFIGTVEADEETTIMPKVAGEVTEKYFEVGDYVNAGDLLFTIDDTELQIKKASADASLESAQASLESAQASLTAQEAKNVATQAEVAATLGTMDTTEMELDAKVDKAEKDLGSAKANQGLSAQTFATYKDQTDDLKDTADDVEDEKGYAKDYKKNLEKKQSRYKSILNAGDTDQAKSLASGYGVSFDDADDTDAVAQKYLEQKTAYNSGMELETALSAATSTYESLKDSAEKTDSSYDSQLLNQIKAAIGVETGKDTVETAEIAKKLAEKYKADYENFTKNKINTAANASLVGADASLITSNSTVKTAAASVKTAQTSVDSANLQIGYTQVTSPVSGTIQAINVTKYNTVSQSTAAYVISSDDSKKITFYVAEPAMRNMQEGQEAIVEKEGTEYKASISKVDTTVDSEKGLFKIEAMVQGDGINSFITGTTVKITTATQQAIDAMTVPIDAVYYEDEQAYVYCMKDGTAVRTDIEAGIADDSVVEVKSGLTPEDKLIVSWASQLKDGALVYEAEKTADEATTEEVTEEATTEEAATEEVEATTEVTDKELIEATDTVKIRSAASTDSEVVGMAAAGDTYTRIEETADGWSKIEFEGSEAYVKSDYVKIADTASNEAESEVASDQEENVNE